ncbi:MAG TPA: hypothetical protein VFJ13_09235 [Paracoccaceae bacterium]|nr:hypothetical protein [Paracoccaceae bacterium]
MTASRSAAGLAVALLLAACATPQEAPAPPPEPELAGPGLPLRMAMTGQPARMLLERVAAACWLDHVVRGGSMIVDRQTGRIVITSETQDLLIAEIVPAGDGTSLVRLTGPAADDPATALRLSETLEIAVTTGRPGCGPAAA